MEKINKKIRLRLVFDLARKQTIGSQPANQPSLGWPKPFHGWLQMKSITFCKFLIL